MTIMKLKFQKPSFSQGSSKVLGGAIAIHSQGLRSCKICKSKKFKPQFLKTFVSAFLCGVTLEGLTVFFDQLRKDMYFVWVQCRSQFFSCKVIVVGRSY